jgi:hypothetical protein
VGHYRGSPNFGTGPLPEARPPLGSSPYSGLFVAMFSSTGQIGWSRGFAPTPGDAASGHRQAWPFAAEAVATDGAGNILGGGRAGWTADPGEGTVSSGVPMLAR